jgi:hypothetical protein
MDSTETVYRTLDVLYEELSKIMESMDREKKAKEELDSEQNIII